MTFRRTPIERAFELARSGDCPTVVAVQRQLIAEGYSVVQIVGPTLKKQLRDLIAAALPERSPPMGGAKDLPARLKERREQASL